MDTETRYRTVPFSEVKSSGFFKEREGGAWYLKLSESEGMYYSAGQCITNRFARNERVLVEQ